jgi:hypothetical protein
MRVEAALGIKAALGVKAATACRRVGMRAEAAVEAEVEAAVEIEATPMWMPAHGHEAPPDWHTVDRVCRRRRCLDSDGARGDPRTTHLRGTAAMSGEQARRSNEPPCSVRKPRSI